MAQRGWGDSARSLRLDDYGFVGASLMRMLIARFGAQLATLASTDCFVTNVDPNWQVELPALRRLRLREA